MLTRREKAERDAGFSMAELLVSMGVMTVVGVMALSFFLWTTNSTAGTSARSFDSQAARGAVSTVTGMLRLAAPGTVASSKGASTLSPITVTFTANDGAVAGRSGTACVLGQSTITYALTNGNLTQTRTGPVSTPSAGKPCAFTTTTATRTLAAGIRSLTFTYSSSVRDANGALTVAQTPGDVANVMVTVTVGGTTKGTVLQTLTSSATISGGTS